MTIIFVFNSFLGAFGSVNKMVFKKNNSVMAVKRIRSTVDEREQKSLLMDLEVVMKSKGCPYIVMFNGAIFKVRIFRCTSTWGPWLMRILILGEIGNNQIWHKNN